MAGVVDKSDIVSQLQELRELIRENTARIERLEAAMTEIVEEEVVEEIIIIAEPKRVKTRRSKP